MQSIQERFQSLRRARRGWRQRCRHRICCSYLVKSARRPLSSPLWRHCDISNSCNSGASQQLSVPRRSGMWGFSSVVKSTTKERRRIFNCIRRVIRIIVRKTFVPVFRRYICCRPTLFVPSLNFQVCKSLQLKQWFVQKSAGSRPYAVQTFNWKPCREGANLTSSHVVAPWLIRPRGTSRHVVRPAGDDSADIR